MKKIITIVSIVGALILILDSLNASHGLLLWVFIGIIPGTDILISPIAVMLLNLSAVTLIIVRLTIWQKVQDLFTLHADNNVSSEKQPNRRRTA